MTLPEGFNEWEHLQYTIRKVHNDAVREFFRGQLDEDIATTKGAAKHACLMKDNDTSSMTTLRMWLFWVICRKMRDNFEPYYGIPVADIESTRKHKPQVTFYFLEDPEDVDPDYSQLYGRITYRIMNETSQTISKAELTALANRIKTEFGQSNGYVWQKGKDMASYTDKANGYQLQLLVRNKTDAKELITKILDTNQDVPDWKYLNYKENEKPTEAYPTIPSNTTILGKTVREPRVRPIASVRFQYAYCSIWGLKKPVILYDRSLTHLDALVSDVSL